MIRSALLVWSAACPHSFPVVSNNASVARALLAQAPYIFADEPTGALDDATASTVLSHLRTAARDGASVIMVTHSHLAAEAADRVISLEEVAHAGVA